MNSSDHSRSASPVKLPSFLEQLLSNPPPAGTGVHLWLFRVARQLHAHMPAGEIVHLLERRVADCGRCVPRREIVAAVQDSIPCAWQPNGCKASLLPTVRRWPELNKDLRRVILRKAGGLVALWDRSPLTITSNDTQTETFIDQLFPGNRLLCCGRDQTDFDTKPREEWRNHLAQLQFIVPSPMLSVIGLTKDGKESRHALSNTGPRRFLVVEFDHGDYDEHAGLLLHLATFAPMSIAVHSGGKSLHGWFFVEGQPDDKVERFMRYAVSLGADSATFCRSQFVRMPDGLRETGERQRVYFFNPRTLRGLKP